MQISPYTIKTSKIDAPLRFAVVADLHNRPYDEVIASITHMQPDMIVVPGDLMLCLDASRIRSDEYVEKCTLLNRNGYAFLTNAAAIAPTFYSIGNHEQAVSEASRRMVAHTGAVLLENADITFREIRIGGLSSGSVKGYFKETPPPDIGWLKRFAALDGFKLLLCHHPEYYPRYIRQLDIDLTIAGHAHGGQWRLFGQGAFAPGQGVFPKYTSGLHENRLIISRGLANTARIPRINNPTELVEVTLVSSD